MDSDGYAREGTLSNFFLKSSKAIPRLGRRKDLPALVNIATETVNSIELDVTVPTLKSFHHFYF